jgi:hypothetical protein
VSAGQADQDHRSTELAMSFTFDDIEGVLPAAVGNEVDSLSAEIAQLRSKLEARPDYSTKIAMLEKKREQLLNKSARKMKHVQVGQSAAEEGGSGSGLYTTTSADVGRASRRIGETGLRGLKLLKGSRGHG